MSIVNTCIVMSHAIVSCVVTVARHLAFECCHATACRRLWGANVTGGVGGMLQLNGEGGGSCTSCTARAHRQTGRHTACLIYFIVITRLGHKYVIGDNDAMPLQHDVAASSSDVILSVYSVLVKVP